MRTTCDSNVEAQGGRNVLLLSPFSRRPRNVESDMRLRRFLLWLGPREQEKSYHERPLGLGEALLSMHTQYDGLTGAR